MYFLTNQHIRSVGTVCTIVALGSESLPTKECVSAALQAHPENNMIKVPSDAYRDEEVDMENFCGVNKDVEMLNSQRVRASKVG